MSMDLENGARSVTKSATHCFAAFIFAQLYTHTRKKKTAETHVGLRSKCFFPPASHSSSSSQKVRRACSRQVHEASQTRKASWVRCWRGGGWLSEWLSGAAARPQQQQQHRPLFSEDAAAAARSRKRTTLPPSPPAAYLSCMTQNANPLTCTEIVATCSRVRGCHARDVGKTWVGGPHKSLPSIVWTSARFLLHILLCIKLKLHIDDRKQQPNSSTVFFLF